jgi:hypothetical protein
MAGVSNGATRGRTLYLIGEENPFAKLGGKDALLRYKMNVKFFPDAGHGINHEISEEINGLRVRCYKTVPIPQAESPWRLSPAGFSKSPHLV